MEEVRGLLSRFAEGGCLRQPFLLRVLQRVAPELPERHLKMLFSQLFGARELVACDVFVDRIFASKSGKVRP